MVKPIQVRLVRSPIGRPEKHRRVLQALGLTRMHRPVNLYSSPQVLGALRKVIHLVKIEER
jgi:large subunit ribosomal protein L30